MSIDKVVWNRLEDMCCVMCGDSLISPKDAELSMCTSCVEKTKKAAQKQIKNVKSRTGNVKRMTIKVDPGLVNYK